MKTSEEKIKYLNSEIVIQTIEFGETVYIYVGSDLKNFNDLTLAMPTKVATQLIGDSPSDELAMMISEIIKKPVLLSYNFTLDSPEEAGRFDYVKTFMRKRYLGK